MKVKNYYAMEEKEESKWFKTTMLSKNIRRKTHLKASTAAFQCLIKDYEIIKYT